MEITIYLTNNSNVAALIAEAKDGKADHVSHGPSRMHDDVVPKVLADKWSFCCVVINDTADGKDSFNVEIA